MLRKRKAFYLILGVFMSTCMTFTGITGHAFQEPTIAYAEDEITSIPEEGVEYTKDHITYKLQADGTLRISTDGQKTELASWFTVPATGDVMKPYKDLILKVIFEEGFVSIRGSGSSQNTTVMKNVQYIKFPDSCTTIGDYCFYGFKNLETIKFGKNLISIGDYVFKDNKVTKINFPSTLKTIGGAFNETGLKTIDLPANVNLNAGGLLSETSFYGMPLVSTLIIRGNYTLTRKGTVPAAIKLKDGVYLSKIVYMADEWNESLLEKPDQHISSNTTIYCTEANYDSVYGALSATGANFKKVTGIDDLSFSEVSDDNVSIDDITNDIEELATGDEAVVAIEGQTDHAVIKLSVPTEVGFVISPRTKSKFITREFEVTNQTGAPVKFTLQGLEPTSSSNELKLLRRDHWNDKYGEEAKTSWRGLGPEDTEKGIALKCYFDADKDGEYEYTFWETPIEDDLTEITFNLSEDGSFKGKLDALYGLAWTTDYTGSYQLKGTVELGTNL